MCEEECTLYIFGFLYFSLLVSAVILEIIVYFGRPILGIIDLSLSLNQSLMINFEMKDSNNSYNSIGPFHKWSGREQKICVKKGDSDKDCEKWETIPLNSPQYIYKIAKKYLTYNNFSSYEFLLKFGFIIKENNTCLPNLKYCGKIDTLNQKLCLPKNIDCPIQDFRINSSPIQGYNYIRYSFNNSISEYILYTNKKTDLFIIGKISLGSNTPCVDIDEENWEKLEEYEIDKTVQCKNDNNGNLFDKRYNETGNLSYINIYQSNLPDDAFSDMKESIKGHNLYVYKRPYIGVDLKCYNNSDFNPDNYKDLKDSIDTISKISIDYIKCAGATLGASFIFNIPDCGPIFVGLYLIGFNAYGFFINLYLTKKFPRYITDFNCSDEFTNSLVKDGNDELKFKFKIMISITIIQFMLAIIIVFVCLCGICSACKEEIIRKREEKREELLLKSIN